jgi:hypothetical protein
MGFRWDAVGSVLGGYSVAAPTGKLYFVFVFVLCCVACVRTTGRAGVLASERANHSEIHFRIFSGNAPVIS